MGKMKERHFRKIDWICGDCDTCCYYSDEDILKMFGERGLTQEMLDEMDAFEFDCGFFERNIDGLAEEILGSEI